MAKGTMVPIYSFDGLYLLSKVSNKLVFPRDLQMIDMPYKPGHGTSLIFIQKISRKMSHPGWFRTPGTGLRCISIRDP